MGLLLFPRCLRGISLLQTRWGCIHVRHSGGAASQDVFLAPEGEEPPVGTCVRAGELSFHAALRSARERRPGKACDLGQDRRQSFSFYILKVVVRMM